MSFGAIERGCALLAALALSASAVSAELAGVHLEPRLQVKGEPLTLVSCGVRDTLWIDHYVAGLYVPPGTSTPAAADSARPKAVRIKVVEARHLPDEIPEKWRGTLERELAREPMSRVRRAYGGLSNGDVVTFAYLPDSGVTMSVNGKPIMRTPGHDLIDEILEAWAEKDTVSGTLHRLRLEHPC